MQGILSIDYTIEHERQGTYFTIPFQMPEGVASLALKYTYERYQEVDIQAGAGRFRTHDEGNIIDLGLISPDGAQVGASGSDKTEITVSESYATPGYHACRLVPGEWRILVGAYKVRKEGVRVRYEIHFAFQGMRLLKGDLHAHTLASDGVLTSEELARHALRHGLDFLAITDHNQMVSREALPQVPGITLLPGVEWTHYRGHANFLGVDRPFDGTFATNTLEEARALFDCARERGALITLNHPFEEGCGYQFDLQTLPFDVLEVWNGPMRESNLRAVGLWQNLLSAGHKLPICGGSDYHRDTPFIFLGGPTTCVYSMSNGPTDILSALKQGRAYITFAPNGPSLELNAGEHAIMGDSVPWLQVKELRIAAYGLIAGDVIRVVTRQGAAPILQAPSAGQFQAVYPIDAPGFARVEILRIFIPGVPMLPALISNPIYFDEE